MSRWWDRYGFRTIVVILALIVAFWIEQTQAAFLSEVYYFIVEPFQVQDQLVLEDRLINARILELEQRVGQLQQQNRQLKQLLDYAETQTVETIAAPIVGRNRDRWWQRVTLGRGKEDGIEPGYTVMGIGGLIGRVTHVTPHTSKVLLISDPTSRVGTVLNGSRKLGYIEGKNSSTVVMHFFDQVTNLQSGGEVVTSNLSNLYPPGLPVGKITIPKSKSNKESFSEVEIKLNAPIDVLEWVIVQTFEPKLSTKVK